VADQPPAPDNRTERPGPRSPGRWPPNWVNPRPTPTTRTPRWVKVFGVIAVLVVLLIAVMLLTGHGPGRHMQHGLGELRTSTAAAPDGTAAFAEQQR
jgi:hypothetical protein